MRANIRASVRHLRHGSEIIENLIQNDGLMIVGAEYSLDTGEVDFFDGIEGAATDEWLPQTLDAFNERGIGKLPGHTRHRVHAE